MSNENKRIPDLDWWGSIEGNPTVADIEAQWPGLVAHLAFQAPRACAVQMACAITRLGASLPMGGDSAHLYAPSGWRDFHSCAHLLRDVPTLRAGLPIVADRLGAAWARMVEAWPELEALAANGEHMKLDHRVDVLRWGSATRPDRSGEQF